MKLEWIVLLCVLSTIYSLDPPNELRQTTSSVSTKSSKNSNKARHKKSKNTNHPSTSKIEPLHDAHESLFPDVIYPTSILEVSQPFYYSQPGNDVLGPFSNDVKSSYKTLNFGKGKLSNDNSVKRQDKNNVSQNITVDNENNYNVLSSNEPLSSNMSVNTEVVENTSYIEDNIEQILNDSGGVQDEIMNQYNSLNNGQFDLINMTLENVVDDVVHENMSYIGEENIKYTLENPTSTTNVNDDVTNNPTQDFLEDTQTIDPNNSYKTYHVNTNPNYIMTSDTGNSHEDFVNDIMNIYSLIEESIRAISVVEFVVSKTLGALGFDDKQNGTIVSENINTTNLPDSIYNDNDTTLNNNIADNIFVNNSYKSQGIFPEGNQIEPNALTSEGNEVGTKVEEFVKPVYNNNQSDLKLEKPRNENIREKMFFKRSTLI